MKQPVLLSSFHSSIDLSLACWIVVTDSPLLSSCLVECTPRISGTAETGHSTCIPSSIQVNVHCGKGDLDAWPEIILSGCSDFESLANDIYLNLWGATPRGL
ncbi:hypothetical protein AVEN_93956-1 [Araneus ventricosus]|uniref:Uncharacterized protein n=1 Tax=Araneus ventricosus TaxID=182803 RepID=A0A4Y2CJN2_ARAVE|nr:hypothetical protein AVEN_93956-1 [Araneus ventricosus]